MKLKLIKRAVFTVEASVIVPLAAFIIAALIGYIFFMHESVWNKSAAYESGFYALQYAVNDSTAKEMALERLNERYEDRVMDLAMNNAEVSDGSSEMRIRWQYGILPEVFGDLFAVDKEVSVDRINPVKAKRFMWMAEYMLGNER